MPKQVQQLGTQRATDMATYFQAVISHQMNAGNYKQTQKMVILK